MAWRGAHLGWGEEEALWGRGEREGEEEQGGQGGQVRPELGDWEGQEDPVRHLGRGRR